ncbi:glycosyltransferase family 4 protein [Robertmurraya korlensis]|uniref:glycosyltransferase family 4 protein n=1 Tax=Robertmurraya korlensis TaxID=519977 RepID=UPI00082547F1|nr:glycosyltransferase family 4 protein [Robertmurraya korlensis]
MNKKILILSNHFITLFNFRKELITKLVEEGHEVFISMPKDDNDFFRDLGCKIIETPVDRRGINPVSDLKLILRYIKIMLSVKPDIIFSYTIKPNIYGCIASKLTKNKQISNITGTGATFLNDTVINEIAKLLYKISIKRSYKVFFQNRGDRDFFIENGMVENNYSLLPGSGVNLNHYAYSELPTQQNISFIFIGRIMKIKGIQEYLDTARVVKERYPNTTFYIAGFIEEDIYKDIINEFHSRGIVNYLGFQNNIKSFIEMCHCTILPSHGGEGVPNVLLESAAMGRICIASNISGSRDVVNHEINGYLFEPKDNNDLTNQVIKFLELDNKYRIQMGLAGRKKVENEFDRKVVINNYLNELENLGV